MPIREQVIKDEEVPWQKPSNIFDYRVHPLPEKSFIDPIGIKEGKTASMQDYDIRRNAEKERNEKWQNEGIKY